MRNIIIDEKTVIQAAELYGTPCLCFEEKEIEHWKKMLINALPHNAEIIYSVKASASRILIDHYIKSNIFFETASEGELLMLLKYGANPEKIWVSGQGKTRKYLETAVSNHITHFHLESPHEISLLWEMIKDKTGYDCCLRVNPLKIEDNTVLQTGGKSSAFGTDESLMESILQSETASIINGIFVYAGSQLFNADDIIKNTEYAFKLAEKFFSVTKRHISSIDFGGGFGVPEKDDIPSDGIFMPELDMNELKKGLLQLFEKYCSKPCFKPQTKYFFESGRYLASRTAVLITQVVDIKESQGKKYLITDGGINHLGVKQKEYRLYPPYINHIGKNIGISAEYVITGTTCTPIDTTHPQVVLNGVSIGDYIYIMDCGAYSVDFSPRNFNGFFDIPEILHTNDKFICYKARGTIDSLLVKNKYIPLNSGSEIRDLLLNSCPKDSDEVQNIAIAAANVKLNKMPFIIYDVCPRGVQGIILLKILKKHYNMIPQAVFSDNSEIRSYTNSECFELNEYSSWAEKQDDLHDYYAMITGSEYSENDISSSIIKIIRSGVNNYMKIESELIDSMELDYYSYYIYHAAELQRAFDLMADLKSKECFLEYMRTVLENDFWRIGSDPLIYKYWGTDDTSLTTIYKHLENEVWLNIGCCNGDTIFRFLMNDYKFSEIHAIDTDLNSLLRCQKNIELIKEKNVIERIYFHNVLLGCSKDKIKIDDLFSDKKVSLINMDIEGAEKDTIESAAELIKKYNPVLAICVYHKPEDLFEIVNTINCISDKYSFYLRKYPNYPYHRCNSKEELVLYAIPDDRII